MIIIIVGKGRGAHVRSTCNPHTCGRREGECLQRRRTIKRGEREGEGGNLKLAGQERGGDYMHVKLRGRGRTEVGEARSCHLSQLGRGGSNIFYTIP